MNSGRVSPKLYDSFSERYRAALDKHYGQLKMEGEERRRMQFQGRVEDLKSAPDGKFQIEKESRFIKRKIEELEGEMRTMERSMGMFNFKSASGEAMKQDMEKKIEKLGRDVERLKGQHRELLKELK
jgi:chaperonin cofactor prefoldin